MSFQLAGTFIKYAVFGIFLLAGFAAQDAWAQAGKSHHESVASKKTDATNLVQVVRESTERFRDVTAAEAAGYALQFGCVTGDAGGAMGMHYVNGALVGDGELDAKRPEIVIYEPTPDGKLKLIGADYLVIAEQWHAKHKETPEIMGQLMHLFEAPNRFGLPPFYTLHVWAWKENPTGMFVNWHNNVSCESFGGTKQ